VQANTAQLTAFVCQVFDSLARELLLGTLEGINATIFAYGQTGSGKTFTITGGPECYADRGLIPRSISFLFQSISQRPTCLYKVMVCTPASSLEPLLSAQHLYYKSHILCPHPDSLWQDLHNHWRA